MEFLIITTLILIVAILAWVIFALIKARQKFKLTRESPVSDRLEKGIEYLQENGKITNDEYQELTKISDSTATRDLDELEKLGLIEQVGKRGKGVYYILKK